jgi:fucose permease
MVIGAAFAPVFASLVVLTPRRVGVAHADNAIGFQIAAAGLGGATLTAAVGFAADAVGLEVIGASVVVITGALLVLYLALTGWGRATRQ